MTAKARGKSIQIDFTHRGQRCRETLKLEPTKANLLFAEHMHSTILHEIAIGTFHYNKHFPDSKRAALFSDNHTGNLLIKDALQSFLDAKKRTVAHSTFISYESAVNHHLTPIFGKTRVSDLTTHAIRQWIGGLTISNKRINNVLIPLRGIFGDAFADGAIERNPMDRIKNLKVVQKDPEPFTFEEQNRILAALDGQGKNLIQFAFWTGLRTSEYVALEWGDIDWIKGTAYVQRALVRGVLKEPKTRAGKREVLLLPNALEALNNQKKFTYENGKQIFHNPVTNKPWCSDVKIRDRVWVPALKAAGVRYRNPYQTRHTYASMLLSAGENPAWISKQMGHTNMTMFLQRYGRYMPDHDPLAGQKIITRMSQIGHMEGLESEKPPVKTRGYNGGMSGIRTPGPRIKSPLLYQLS